VTRTSRRTPTLGCSSSTRTARHDADPSVYVAAEGDESTDAIEAAGRSDEGSDGSDLEITLFTADGVTEREPGFGDGRIDNTTSTDENYVIEIGLGDWGDPIGYLLGATLAGYDLDEDGYYRQDWETSRDCDDTAAP
jgi:hypothetical protein